MKKLMMAGAALALGTTAATAGGVERSTQSVGILFEKGNYAELNFGGFKPDVSGTVAGGLVSSGDMAVDYGTYSLGYKQALNDKIDLAIIIDQSTGAKVNYPAGLLYPLSGSTASITSNTVTALLRYKLPENFSLIGGLRIDSASGKARLTAVTHPLLGTYTLNTSTETDLGYVVGVAWEKPEIAARVALTYNSKIDHKFKATEWGMDPTLLGAATDRFTTTIPESVNLEFQTGVAKDTLVFGSVRWVHWTQFDISPPIYSSPAAVNDALVSYSSNTTTYTLGVGRKFSEKWSGAVSIGYEKHDGGTVGNLGPTDGYKSIGLAATYQATDNIKISGGLRYVDIGNAVTNAPISGQFKDNSGWGAGIRVGITF
ncbi:MAG: outer membrane protein transport protein [Paenirhodobacter sp.]|uniref:outer membrane protein transport protein n=1 Tax=Paenirhodobacter sp. TaxID=1965326 RepID=UPI003D137003